MKRMFLFFSVMTILMANLLATIFTNPAGGTANVGASMGFRQDCNELTSVLASWDWGDGQMLSGVPANTAWVYHAYRNPGSYTVHAHRYNFTVTPSCSPSYTDEYVTVSILENRAISPVPASPTVGQTVTFTAGNFNTPSNITWFFGDGSTLAHAGSSVTHAYAAAGTYTVRAYDWDGDTSTTAVTRVLTVSADNRQISASPASPTAGQTVTFTASNFNTPSDITWFFGDGSTLAHAGSSVTHAYSGAGTYTIQAYDWGGNFNMAPVTHVLTVSADNRQISASPASPTAGQTVTFTASNFNTPSNITWFFGDGSTLAHAGSSVTHAYAAPGTYTVQAYDWGGNTQMAPVTYVLTVSQPVRSITFSPQNPRVDQPVTIQAINFQSNSIDWNFGDGSPLQTLAKTVSHRYANPGTFTITGKEHGLNLPVVSKAITILPENRSLTLSAPEARINEPVTVKALNFRGPLVLWNFGDGSSESGPTTISHSYKLPGSYTISARDENGASQKIFQAVILIIGISDTVNLEIAEITLDNGKYYKVVPKNSRNIRAHLRMKLRGTGIVSGYWIVDGQPYQFFNETVFQGQIKTILTPEVPGLPVFDPGMHTITMKLTRPAGKMAVFPTLRYYVLPYENEIAVLAPVDGAVIKEDAVATFAWENALGGSYYQIAFASSFFSLLHNDEKLQWHDCPERNRFTPDATAWGSIRRNEWTYWKVRATDSGGGVVAESGIMEMKIIIPGAQVGIRRITDMDGRDIAIGGAFTASNSEQVLIQGGLVYPAAAEYLVLRVYANGVLVDQLLFRNVRKNENRPFETSVPNTANECRVVFEVLKSSSPAVLVGYAELKLKRD